MLRRLAPALLAIPLLVGCAGPAKLAERSEEKLATGDHWRAWQLATRALDKAPANARAREAALAAANSIANDWRRKIRAIAQTDSLAAAQSVLEFVDFRANAAQYVTVPVAPDWAYEEQTIRRAAARAYYESGLAALESRRPKKAYLDLMEAEHYVTGYRDAAKLADRAYQKALTRVAFVPFLTSSANSTLGNEVTAGWSDELARRMNPPAAHFTRIVGAGTIEGQMTVSQLGRISREEAARLGRKAGVERVVWGSIGGVDSKTGLNLFAGMIARRIVVKGLDGQEVTRWVDVPFEVISRTRTVTVDVEYEVIATKGGATVARQRSERSTSARVLWTSYLPEGDLDAYALVSESVRAADPERAKQVESRWRTACGEKTTLRQVLEARRSTRSSARYSREVLPRFIAGAAFVLLQDLPPAEDLALAALAGGWEPLLGDLQRLDPVDDVDLGMAAVGSAR